MQDILGVLPYLVWASKCIVIPFYPLFDVCYITAFSGVRTFAVTRNRMVAAFVFVLSMAPFGLNCVSPYLL